MIKELISNSIVLVVAFVLACIYIACLTPMLSVALGGKKASTCMFAIIFVIAVVVLSLMWWAK